MKKRFKLYDQSLIGHLNFIGMTFFSLIILLTLIFYHDLVPSEILRITSFLSIYIIATANINRIILPYRKHHPGFLFISKRNLLRHLFFTTIKGYSFQLLFAMVISIAFMVRLNEYLILGLSIITVIISFLSQLTYGLLKILLRVMFLLQLWSILTLLYGLAIFITIIQLVFIFFYIFNYNKITALTDFSILNSSHKRLRPGNIVYILCSYILTNKILLVCLGTLMVVSTYYAQLLLTKIPNLPDFPVLMVILINFMTVIEILIGQKSEEIVLDKARTETLQSSLVVKSFKRFTSSTLYVLSLMIILLCLFGIIGLILNTSDSAIMLMNFISIPLILFIGIVYYRKAELLITGSDSKVLKLTLPILMLISITIFTIVS